MRIEQLRVRNYRVLKDVTFTDLTPLTVLCGANGAGKSTLLEALGFLRDVFAEGLRPAWARSRRGGDPYSYDGPVQINLRLTQVPEGRGRALGYHVSIQRAKTRFFVNERVWWEAPDGAEDVLLAFEDGDGWYRNESTGKEVRESLADDDLLAVSVLAQLQGHPLIKSLRDFFRGWSIARIVPASIRMGRHEPGRLSASGDNLFAVLQDLKADHEYDFNQILRLARHYVPLFSHVTPYEMPDGTLDLQMWDDPFETPTMSAHISDGTLQLLGYLTLLRDPRRGPVIGVDEPENQLHPKVLYRLAEEFRRAAERSQVFVTTHSPDFVNAILPDELWALSREADGYVQVRRAASDPLVMAMMEEGAQLGSLWSEGFLKAADPAVAR